MANLSKTRTVFAFTSPRTIEKIIPEIQILIESFNGQSWNTITQTAFFNELFKSEFYDGNRMPSNIPLAARDRITRAPKALGFVDLKPIIAITPVGVELLSRKRTHEVIARQLFKFQLPSPYHRIPVDRDFNVRPYLELLRLIKTVGLVSKTEIAIFFVQLTNYHRFESIVGDILRFREERKAYSGNKKAFVLQRFNEEIVKIYHEEIAADDLKTRESGDVSLMKFIKTKRGNHLDYADAFIRYLRATQLVSFEKKTFRLIISATRQDEVDFILSNVPREALTFASEANFKKYLFDPKSVELLTDKKEYLEEKLAILGVEFDPGERVANLKDKLESTEARLINIAIHDTEVSLKDYKEYDDVFDVFSKIIKKTVPDPPLYLEWNVWRSLVMINYLKGTKPNFTVDLDGMPLNTALGNLPDIELDYGTFKVIVEVTMSNGNKQYEMEGEPVPRHFGKIQKDSKVPVYCLFVAPKISEGALAHFFNLNRFNTKAYGGKTRIIPLSLEQFMMLITVARNSGFKNPDNLKSYFDAMLESNQSSADEAMWYNGIITSIPNWVNN